MLLGSVKRLSLELGLGVRRQMASLAVFILWAAVTVRQFWFADATDFTAKQNSYDTLTTWSLLFLAAALGLQRFGNRPEVQPQ